MAKQGWRSFVAESQPGLGSGVTGGAWGLTRKAVAAGGFPHPKRSHQWVACNIRRAGRDLLVIGGLFQGLHWMCWGEVGAHELIGGVPQEAQYSFSLFWEIST